MQEVIHDAQRLKELQALPLERKVLISQARIIEWHKHWNGKVYVSYSGGKDSSVLLHLVRQLYPDVPAVFCNTGLEYPEIQKLVRSKNAEIITPIMRFDQVITKYGYPLISKEVALAIYYARRIRAKDAPDRSGPEHKRIELLGERTSDSGKSLFNKVKWLSLCQQLPAKVSHYCCNVMKKQPAHKYERASKLKPYIGTLASESRIRKQHWIKTGCNAFEGERPVSQPIGFWTDQDILSFIKSYNVEIASVYGDVIPDEDGNLKCTGCDRTGCIFCGIGLQLERTGKTKFQKLAETHPRQYEYCIGGGEWADNPDYDPTAPKYDGEWENWNPKKIWVPSKEGLGMGKVFDMVNEIYGMDLMRYK